MTTPITPPIEPPPFKVTDTRSDPGCICRGNWRAIVKDTRHLIDKQFTNPAGKVYTFFGIVLGSDDYYYGMYEPDGRNTVLLSCVGSLKSHGFDPTVRTDDAIR